MQGCGGDANPQPMGSIAIAEAHGKALAGQVEEVLGGKLQPVIGHLSTQFAMAKLPLQPLTRETLKPFLSLPNFQARQAAHMQDLLNAGQTLITSYDAPIATWQLGDELTLVALPGEPVAEYVGLLHNALGAKNLWVAGYDNDCFGYLPTAKVVKEGGHEAIGITLWAWGKDLDRQVGFFAPDVQDVIVKTSTDLARKAGRRIESQN
jgi:neutral ceramidase